MRANESVESVHVDEVLADVALAGRFSDQAHLSRMLKHALGVTPARYRALEANRVP